MEYMKTIPDKFFELAIADPPYGINAPNMQMGANANRGVKGGSKGWSGETTAPKLRKGRLNSGGEKLTNRILNSSSIDWDNTPPPPEYFKELFRVSKNQIIWGGNYFELPPTRGVVVWDKKQPWDNFSQVELAWTSFDCPAKIFRHSNRGGDNLLEKIHPTEKPYYLYQFCIKNFAKEGDKIFDPGMGSQMSRIVAYDMGFDYYGCDNDPIYFEDGCKRFKKHIKKGLLFRNNKPQVEIKPLVQGELF